MDPTSLFSQTAIPEIWQFPLVGVPPGGVAVTRINARDNNYSVVESTVTDQSAGSRGRRRRRDSAPPSEDESSKLVSTSSGNDAARREKIGERMKILQDLVPGCNKVIGEASVLDEIINYVQALQRQVEFLSMKLEAVNSFRMNSGIEGFPPKDVQHGWHSPVPSWTTVYGAGIISHGLF